MSSVISRCRGAISWRARPMRNVSATLVRNFSDKSPPPMAGNGGLGALPLLLTLGAIGGGVYYVRQYMLVKEDSKTNMTLEEYEQWRLQQSKKFGDSKLLKFDTDVASKEPEVKPAEPKKDEPPADIPAEISALVPKKELSKDELKQSLISDLLELRKMEKDIIVDIKKRNKAVATDDEKEQLQLFRDQKLQIKKQLKALN